MTTPKRPTTMTPEIKKVASLHIAQMMVNDGQLEQGQLEECAEDIACVAGRHDDGYEIAKQLEDVCYWDCNMQMLENLDAWSNQVSALLKKEQEAWVTMYDVKPEFKAFDRVKFVWGGEAKTGLIQDIYEHGPAQYTITLDGTLIGDKSKALVNFEDVEVA